MFRGILSSRKFRDDISAALYNCICFSFLLVMQFHISMFYIPFSRTGSY